MLNKKPSEFTEGSAPLVQPPPASNTLAGTLLEISSARQPRAFVWAGVALYFAAAYALVTFDFSTPPIVLEDDAVEMVFEEAAPAQEAPEPPQPEPEPPPPEVVPPPPEPPPPVAEAPPEPPPPEPPPPPPVVEEPIAEAPPPPPPPPPKPVAQPPPKPVQKPPAKPAQKAGPVTGAASAGSLAGCAAKVRSRINGVAQNTAGKKGTRLAYTLTVGAAGQVLSASGPGASIVRRAGPFPPPCRGQAFTISGGIQFQ